MRQKSDLPSDRSRREPREIQPLLDLLDTHVRERRPLPGRNGKVNIKFLADVSDVGRMQLRNRIEMVEKVAAIVGIADRSYFNVEMTGQLDDAPWIEGVSSHFRFSDSLSVLALMLQAACYVIISFLSGMRDSEVKHLRRNCIQVQRDSDGAAYRWRVKSLAFKGESEVEAVEASWVVAPAVARAVKVLEDLQMPESDYLFCALPWSPGRKQGAEKRTLGTWSTTNQLQMFREWINNYCVARGRTDAIPDVNGQPWCFTTSQFRRTLAWFIAREPGGSIAGAIQYRHMSIQMFEGYAGTSDSGFRAEVEAEEAVARGEVLLNSVEKHAHKRLSGPAAAEAEQRLAEFGRRMFAGSVVIDPKRVAKIMKRHDPAIYPGKYATCVFNPDKALCRRVTSMKGLDQPLTSNCKPLTCQNAALDVDNLAALSGELHELEEQLRVRPGLPPMLQHTVNVRIDALRTFIAHNTRSDDSGPAAS
ncbi:hypothetical protein A5722_32295 [Mycobacterium vulneris]|nr:hypothetical protein A5722_32295 [Mycolicibacterium vulneris]OCB67831.1 hypothetical protein A5729_06810 [Mycolicibacterium vulneris]